VLVDFDTILYEKDAGRARIILNRPEKLNALSGRLQHELNSALWEADNDAAVRVYRDLGFTRWDTDVSYVR